MESLVVVFLMFSPVLSTYLSLPEGAACQDDWVCTTPDMCSVLGDMSISRPQICSFNGSQVILCCPPTIASPKSSKITTSSHCEYVHCQYAVRNYIQSTEKKYIPPGTYVAGGYPVPPGSHRHMALIGYGKSQSSIEWKCGGSVISRNYILSAAHCARSKAGEFAGWVKVGDLDLESETDDAKPETIKIAQIIVHPEYKPPAIYNDIALFRLGRYLYFNFWVGPVCLHFEPEVPATHATVTGWGRTDIVEDTSSRLLGVEVPLVASRQCRKLLGTSRLIPNSIDTETMLCAGEKEGGKDACSGDSGGPLVINSTTCQKTQIGVISFGRMCALPNVPGVYTRIYPFLPWIQSIVWPSLASGSSP